MCFVEVRRGGGRGRGERSGGRGFEPGRIVGVKGERKGQAVSSSEDGNN